ncbi:MAG TPA: DHA2 family efflux MFS transporter permease subunit [Pseudonocardiaceae bacterium]|nr:DHA2 family efflux MFS transporter permease subunit [Pseudonocardiaceae bacterium]
MFTGLALAMLLASLDQTIVATALPVIACRLGGLDNLSWIIIAYQLATAVSSPLWGRTSDLYGRKRLLIAAVGVFLSGSALCGIAGNIGELIAFRAVQGAGAGGIISLAMAVVADVVAPRQRGRYQGYLQLVFTLAGVLGPLLGGLLVELGSWRWVFYGNLPVGAIALVIIATRLELPAARTERAIDYPGAALFVTGVVCLLLVTEFGGQRYAWTSTPTLGLVAGAVVLLLAFAWWERRAAEPILPLRLFRNSVFLVVTVTFFLATSALFAVVVFVPVFLQIVVGVSAVGSGLLILPMTLGVTAATIVSGRLIARTGRYKFFPVIGLVIASVGVFLLSRVSPGTSWLTVSLCMLLFGCGFGLVTQVLVIAVQNGAERRDIGVATASANFFRSLGGSIGTAVFGAVFVAGLSGYSGVDAHSVQASPGAIRNLAGPARAALVNGVAHATDLVFLVATPVAVLALLAVFLLKEQPLRN